MELTKIFLNSLNLKTDLQTVSNQPSSSRSNKSFESYLDSSNKKNHASNMNNTTKKTKNSVDSKKQKSDTQEQSFANKKQIKQSPQQSQESDTKAVESSEKPVLDNVDKKELNNKIVKKLSESLNIPEEEINQMLDQLNINAFALLQPENVSKLVQLIAKVDEPLQLLNIPNIQEVFETINNVLEEFKSMDIDITDFQKTFDLESSNIDESDVKANTFDQAALKTNTTNNKTEAEAEEKEQALPIVEVVTSEDDTPNQNNNAFGNGNAQQDVDDFFVKPQENSKPVEQVVQSIKTDGDSVVIEKTVTQTKSSRTTQSSIINQIVEKIKIDLKSDITEMKITLKPNELGQLSLKISTENGVISALILAENQQVKEIIEANFNVLKDALAEQGIRISELSVNVGTESSEKREFAQNHKKSSRRIEQILDGINSEEVHITETVNSTNYANPYEVNDNSIDFSA